MSKQCCFNSFLMSSMVAGALLLVVGAVEPVLAAMQPPLWTVKQSLGYTRIGRVVPSPTGNQYAYLAYRIVPTSQGKRWQTRIYIQHNHSVRKLRLRVTGDVSQLRWSPDGQYLSYLWHRAGHDGVWKERLNTGERSPIIETDQAIVSYKWSPKSDRVGLVMQGRGAKVKTTRVKGGGVEREKRRLYIVAASQKKGKTAAKAQRITRENDQVMLLARYLDGGFSWSPDGKRIVVALQPAASLGYWNDVSLKVITLATKQSATVAYTRKHAGIQPQFSPDGQRIAFRTNLVGMTKQYHLKNDLKLAGRVCVTSLATKKTNCLSDTYNQNPRLIGWRNDGKQVLVYDKYKSQGNKVYALSVDGGNTSPRLLSSLSGYIHAETLAFNANTDSLGMAIERVDHLPMPVVSNAFSIRTRPSKQLATRLHYHFGGEHLVHWNNGGGKMREGVLLTPATHQLGVRLPLLVLLNGQRNDAFSARFMGSCWGHGTHIIPLCQQDILNKGVVIFEPNITGSDGYGAEFRLGHYADAGEADYQDVLTGVNALVDRGIVDAKHIMVMGWGYGGYLATMLAIKDHRFGRLINGAGISNWISFAGTSRSPQDVMDRLGRPFWQAGDLYLRRSPVMQVSQIKAPVLLMAGDRDGVVPFSQSLELYNALRQQQRSVTFYLFHHNGYIPGKAHTIVAATTFLESWIMQGGKD